MNLKNKNPEEEVLIKKIDLEVNQLEITLARDAVYLVMKLKEDLDLELMKEFLEKQKILKMILLKL